jgi:formylmethanofuran dehydrogenase subunit B
MGEPGMSERIIDVVCPFCGCLCDDLEVEVADGKIISVDNACSLGIEKMLGSGIEHRLKTPIKKQDDSWTSLGYDDAVLETVEILTSADRPLLYGWSGTSVEAQQMGIAIAEELHGIIDSTTSICHGPSIIAIQEVGHPGCTLGQVKNRADLIIYWACNPIEGHPRHLSRYTTYVDGYFLDHAFRDRTVVVVDVRKTATANLADRFIRIKPGGDYAVFSALRALVRGREDAVPDIVAGIPKSELIEIVQLCKNARFGALFFGVGLTMTPGKQKNIRNAIEFIDELNRHTKFTITPMRGHYNVYGFNEVCTWLTGYPFAVDFTRGWSYYNPGETTAVDILARRECDACLVVASDPGAHLPGPCVRALADIPVVQIDPVANLTTPVSQIQIPVAITGIDAGGTAYRMDAVPIRLKKIMELQYPSDITILSQIYEGIKKKGH